MSKPANAKESASLRKALESAEYPSGSLLASVCATRGLASISYMTTLSLSRAGLIRAIPGGGWVVA